MKTTPNPERDALKSLVEAMDAGHPAMLDIAIESARSVLRAPPKAPSPGRDVMERRALAGDLARLRLPGRFHIDVDALKEGDATTLRRLVRAFEDEVNRAESKARRLGLGGP